MTQLAQLQAIAELVIEQKTPSINSYCRWRFDGNSEDAAQNTYLLILQKARLGIGPFSTNNWSESLMELSKNGDNTAVAKELSENIKVQFICNEANRSYLPRRSIRTEVLDDVALKGDSTSGETYDCIEAIGAKFSHPKKEGATIIANVEDDDMRRRLQDSSEIEEEEVRKKRLQKADEPENFARRFRRDRNRVLEPVLKALRALGVMLLICSDPVHFCHKIGGPSDGPHDAELRAEGKQNADNMLAAGKQNADNMLS